MGKLSIKKSLFSRFSFIISFIGSKSLHKNWYIYTVNVLRQQKNNKIRFNILKHFISEKLLEFDWNKNMNWRQHNENINNFIPKMKFIS